MKPTKVDPTLDLHLEQLEYAFSDMVFEITDCVDPLQLPKIVEKWLDNDIDTIIKDLRLWVDQRR